jgi:hypothetical protein
MMDNPVFVLFFAAIPILGYAVFQRCRDSLPPGPRGIPVVGNILDMPNSEEWLYWEKLRELHGTGVCIVFVKLEVTHFHRSRDICYTSRTDSRRLKHRHCM